MGEMAYQTARAASSAAKVAKKAHVDLSKEAAKAGRNRVKAAMEARKTTRVENKVAKVSAKEDRNTLKELRKEKEVETFMKTAKKVETLGEKKKTVTEQFLNARTNVPEDLRYILDAKKFNNKKWLEENVGDETKRELVTKYNQSRFARNRVDKNMLKTTNDLESLRVDIIGNEKFKELPRLMGLTN